MKSIGRVSTYSKDPDLVLCAPLYEVGLKPNLFVSRDMYGHLCTVTGALWTPQGRTFDGDDKITAGNAASLQIVDELTILAWVRSTDLTLTNDIVAKKASVTWWVGYGLGVNSTGQLFLIAARNINETGGQLNSPAGEIAINTTYFVAGTRQRGANGLKLYKNSNLLAAKDTYDADMGNASTKNLTIGADSHMDRYWFYGTIGEVMIWNRALSQPEIANYHLSTRWRYQ